MTQFISKPKKVFAVQFTKEDSDKIKREQKYEVLPGGSPELIHGDFNLPVMRTPKKPYGYKVHGTLYDRFTMREVFVGDWIVSEPDGTHYSLPDQEFRALYTPVEPVKVESVKGADGFREKLCHLINSHSLENESDTPDFILADYLMRCLENFDTAVSAREHYHGREKREETVSLSPRREQ